MKKKVLSDTCVLKIKLLVSILKGKSGQNVGEKNEERKLLNIQIQMPIISSMDNSLVHKKITTKNTTMLWKPNMSTGTTFEPHSLYALTWDLKMTFFSTFDLGCQSSVSGPRGIQCIFIKYLFWTNGLPYPYMLYLFHRWNKMLLSMKTLHTL